MGHSSLLKPLPNTSLYRAQLGRGSTRGRSHRPRGRSHKTRSRSHRPRDRSHTTRSRSRAIRGRGNLSTKTGADPRKEFAGLSQHLGALFLGLSYRGACNAMSTERSIQRDQQHFRSRQKLDKITRWLQTRPKLIAIGY